MGSLVTYVRKHHVGLLALFVALGGTAYAAVEVEKNSIKSKHIGKGQVKRADIAPNAIDSTKIADGKLLLKDFTPGELPAGTQALPGPQGAEGPIGPTGPAGGTGPAGLTRAGFSYAGDGITVNSCGEAQLRQIAISVTEPSQLLAMAQSKAATTTADSNEAALKIVIQDSGGTPVGYLERYHDQLEPGINRLTAVGVVKDGAFTAPLTMQPGTYTLKLMGDNSGICAGGVSYYWTSLDYVLLGSG